MKRTIKFFGCVLAGFGALYLVGAAGSIEIDAVTFAEGALKMGLGLAMFFCGLVLGGAFHCSEHEDDWIGGDRFE